MSTTPVNYHVEADGVHFSGLSGINAFRFTISPGRVVYGMAYDEFIARAGDEGEIDVSDTDHTIVNIRPGRPDMEKHLAELREYYGR